MYKAAYTARELSELQLDNYPNSVRGMAKKALTEGWPTQERQASGGGYEYPFKGLPVDLQKSIIFKLAEDSKLNGMQADFIAFDEFKATPAITGEERKLAKLAIVALFDKFRASCGMPILQAETAFVAMYEASVGKTDAFAPKWVWTIYPSFSVQSLRRWRSMTDKDTASLGGRYGNRKGASALQRAHDGDVANFIAATLVSMTHLKAGHIRDLCRARWGETLTVDDVRSGEKKTVPMPKIRAFERHIACWKIEHADIHEQMTNPDAFKNKRMMALGKADGNVHELNQVWQIDASPADAICEGGRFTVYALIDVWSRRVMFSVTKTPRTEASLLLLRRAILEWGMPETVKTDNGSDFVSKRFQMALLALGIKQDICPPFSPERKPYVERVIRTMQHDLMVMLPGFVGHSVSDRKQIEAKKVFAQRLGVSDQDAFCVSLTHKDLQERLDQWAAHVYMHKEHAALKATPFARVASWSQPIKRIENARALDLLLAPLAGGDGLRTMGKKGLRISNGLFYGAGLEMFVGKNVMVRHDPDDMGRVYAFDEDGQFICEATDYSRLGVNPAAASAEANARRKKFFDEETKDIKREMRKITPEYVSENILSLAAREASKIKAFPKQSESYTTPALDEAGRATAKHTQSTERTADQNAKQEAFVIKFNQRQHKSANESDEDRWWKRAMRIEAATASGSIVTDQDREWHETIAITSTWYKSRKRIEEMKAATETVEA